MAAPAVIVITQSVLSLLKNKWFWIGLGILIILIIVINQWSNIRSFIKRKTQKEDIDLTPEEKVLIAEGKKPLTDKREAYLKQLAQLLHSDIYDTPITGHNSSLYIEAKGLSDTELKFMAKYYRVYITKGEYLAQDIDDEIYSPFTNIDSLLMARLAKVGEKSF